MVTLTIRNITLSAHAGLNADECAPLNLRRGDFAKRPAGRIRRRDRRAVIAFKRSWLED